jgi:hypothetical protein
LNPHRLIALSPSPWILIRVQFVATQFDALSTLLARKQWSRRSRQPLTHRPIWGRVVAFFGPGQQRHVTSFIATCGHPVHNVGRRGHTL